MFKQFLRITIFGVGGTKYKAFSAQLQKALEELVLGKILQESDFLIEEVEDVDFFIQNNIARVPAIAVNGSVIANYEVPSIDEIKTAILAAIPTSNK